MEILVILESLAFIFGVISVYKATQQNKETWWYGLLNVAFMMMVFLMTELYYSASLQVVYGLSSIIGLMAWLKDWRPSISWVTLLSIWLIGSFITNYLNLSTIWDSQVFVLALLGTILLVAKDIRCWAFFILSDIIGVKVCLEMGLYVSATQYLFFILLCIKGYKEWKSLKTI